MYDTIDKSCRMRLRLPLDGSPMQARDLLAALFYWRCRSCAQRRPRRQAAAAQQLQSTTWLAFARVYGVC